MIIKPEEQSRKDAYFFAISFIIPRPVAFITSLSPEGVVNAAPFSYFNGIYSSPPLITISIANKKNEKKDTMKNILTKKEFVVNMVNTPMAEGVTASAAEFDFNDSEMNYNGFSLTDSVRIDTPRIAESPAAMECQLVRTIDDLGPFTLVIAEVKLYHVDDDLINPETGYVDAEKAQMLGRLGGSDFSKQGDVITVKRKTIDEYKNNS